MTTTVDTSLKFALKTVEASNGIQSDFNFVTAVKNSDFPNSEAKRLELLLYPTPYQSQVGGRVITLTTDTLGNMDTIRFLTISSDKPFIYALAESIGALGTAVDRMARTVFLDFSEKPVETIIEGTDYPNSVKVIRLLNPLGVNGGGTGLLTSDTPILVTVIVHGTRVIPTVTT